MVQQKCDNYSKIIAICKNFLLGYAILFSFFGKIQVLRSAKCLHSIFENLGTQLTKLTKCQSLNEQFYVLYVNTYLLLNRSK